MITAKQLKQFAKKQRANLTPAEAEFKGRLDAADIAYKNHPVIGFFIPDFVIHTRLLVVEIDGGYHTEPEQILYDARREVFLREVGFKIVRIKNEDVMEWPLSELDQYPLYPESNFRTLTGRANALKGVKMHKASKKHRTKPWKSPTRKKPSSKNQRLRLALSDILRLESQLCVCIDDYKIKGKEDPCCQSHEWAREIRALMKYHHVRVE